MNERIKELAEQAGLEFDDDLVLEPEPIYYIKQKEFEKFAELIVRECANMVEEHQPRYLTRGQAQEMADTIKQHFGVEQ